MAALLIAICAWFVLGQGLATEVQPQVEPGAAKASLKAPQPIKAVPTGRRLLIGRASRYRANQEAWQAYLVHRETVLSDTYVTEAKVGSDEQTRQPVIKLTFDPQGARLFEAFTRANIKRRLAIVLDGEVMSAPVIQTPIPGGRALITLGGGRPPKEMKQEAEWLAALLRTSSLPAPLKLEAETTAPNGLRLVVSVDTKDAEQRWLSEWAGAIEAGLAGAGVAVDGFVRTEAGYRLTFADGEQAGLLARLLAWLPNAPQAFIDQAKPGSLSISPHPGWRMGTRAIQWSRAVLAQRMDELDLDGEAKIELDGRITITLEGKPNVMTAKSALLRTGRLEFVAVDDTKAYMASLTDRLPHGIRGGIDTYGYDAGRSFSPSRYWRSEGPGGRERLEAFIKEISRP